MKTLLILRHAKSSWANARLGDHDRPLNKRGKRDAPKMGKLLKKEGLAPDLIISSSARRAVKTAGAAATACGYEGEIIVTRELYHAGPDGYVAILKQLGAAHGIIMVVGHNPGVEDLLEELIGRWERMPTAALAEVRLEMTGWAELSDVEEGELVNLWLPRELGD